MRKKLSKETKEKLKKANLGKKHSEETRRLFKE
ncbi:MAG TPA: NUMOD3 domain-containing DNA-binding protein [Candidatus Paceibacterota bacterium]|nr:NUMOD3 domain-containing DNA-binding protein [Candidatus Paceibacterota bacterium]